MRIRAYKTLKARVLQGIRLLDTKNPGWRRAIKLRALDLSEPTLDPETGCGCVLAQVFGSYGEGTAELSIDQEQEARACGFERGYVGNDVSNSVGYADLDAEWRRQLEGTVS